MGLEEKSPGVKGKYYNLQEHNMAVDDLEDELTKECKSASVAKFVSACKFTNAEIDRADIEAGNFVAECTKLNNGGLSKIMPPSSSGGVPTTPDFITALGLTGTLKHLEDKAKACGAVASASADPCSKCSGGALTPAQCAAKIQKLSEPLGESANSMNTVLGGSPKSFSGGGAPQIAGKDGGDGKSGTASGPGDQAGAGNGDGKGDGNGGDDPFPSDEQPYNGENDQYGNAAAGEGNGGGGGLGGLGGMLQQMLPLAMMAAMMNQDYEQKGLPKPPKGKDPIKAFCVDNPDSQVCVSEVDCSNEEVAALNPQQCLCSDPQVARVTPICNQKPAPGNVGSLEPTVSDSRGLLGTTGLTDLLSGPPAVLPVEGGAVGVDANQRGGGGGGPSATGGPSAKLGGGGGGGHAPGPYNTDIMKGVGKGGGGGAAGGGGGAAGGGGGGSYAYGGRGGSGDDGGDEEEFNLRKYLPQEDNREIAGMTLKTTDGVTGPFGPTLWNKISQRYKKIQPYMKP